MTPLPKRRWSTRRQGKRRATLVASKLTAGKCPECGAPRPNHLACPKCGNYRGRLVIKPKTEKTSPKSIENAQ